MAHEHEVSDLLRGAKKRGDEDGGEMASRLELRLVEAGERRARVGRVLGLEGVRRDFAIKLPRR